VRLQREAREPSRSKRIEAPPTEPGFTQPRPRIVNTFLWITARPPFYSHRVAKPKTTDPKPEPPTPLIAGATHTWEALVKAVPEPTPAHLELFALRTPPAALIERGSHIRSEKILTDMVRLCGVAAEFYLKATEAQRRLLLGFSSALLSVTVHSGVKLGGMVGDRGATVDEREANRAADMTTAATTYREGMDERDRLATALEIAVDGELTLETRFDSARGRVTDHPTLTTSLLALVKFARGLLLDKASHAGRQLVEGGLTEAGLDETTALAARVKSSGANATGARTQGAFSKAEIDLQDGVCLAYLERIMKVWNGAHERDPSVPQLLPIATRRMFSPTRKRAAEAPAEAPVAGDAAADPAAVDEKKPA